MRSRGLIKGLEQTVEVPAPVYVAKPSEHVPGGVVVRVDRVNIRVANMAGKVTGLGGAVIEDGTLLGELGTKQ